MSQNRRALLLAIADYRRAEPLPYVAGDLPRMRRALDLMGVPAANVEAHGPGLDGTPDLSTAQMRSLIQDFLSSANEGDDLVVYFSGHGIEQEGHRFLVPQDYDIRYPLTAAEMISDVNLFTWARRSKAASVLILIDACRVGVKLTLALDEGTKSLTPAKARTTAASEHVPTIAIVFSCASGQESGKETDKGECSAFTRAMAEALEAEDEHGRLDDVVGEAQARLNAFAAVPQNIAIGDLSGDGRSGAARALIVKASPAAQFRDRLDNSVWVTKLKDLRSWQLVEKAAPALATQVAAIVLRTEDQVGRAAAMLPQQQWRAQDAPFRMLKRIEDLLLEHVEIEPAEAAVLLAVPFVYEVVLAAAEVRLANEGNVLDPLSGEERSEATRFWRAWRNACLNDEASQRQIERLRERGKGTTADDVALWRLSAFCHRAGELWASVEGSTSHSGWVMDEVADALAPVPLDQVRSDKRVEGILTRRRLLRAARLMFADFEDVALDASAGQGAGLNRQARFGEGTAELRLDEIKVVHFLNLGSRLALDARRLPTVLVEHLGSDDRLTINGIQDALTITEWHAPPNVLSLGLECPHEALDAALREAVDDLDAYRRHLLDLDQREREPFDELPSTFNTKDLKAGSCQGRSVYDPNHLRFALDQGRVMRLLMGKELYGNPDLALRELYQNALDACRYRHAHELYLQKTQTVSSYDSEYEGRIAFRFGMDGDARRFVECLDNGVGMADQQLRRLFARAGQRFTDSHEYHLDKARWEAAGVPFFPNSRFGIGVLSYFMLAEELELESQRVHMPEASRPAHVHARVLGSGSLFRLDNEASGAVVQGGTRMRLYLEDRQRPLEEYRQSIVEWLWLPEFRTILDVDGASRIELQPGLPSERFRQEMGPLIPISGTKGATSGARGFWCLRLPKHYSPEGGLVSALLADGIHTSYKTDEGHQQHDIRGTAINLTEELRPELSVDRCHILSAGRGVEFIQRCVREGGWRDLANWDAPKLAELLSLLASFPHAFVRYSDALRKGDILTPPIAARVDRFQVSLPSAGGVCDIDTVLFRPHWPDSTDQPWQPYETFPTHSAWGQLLALRLSELANAGLQLPPEANLLARFVGARFREHCPSIAVSVFNPFEGVQEVFLPTTQRLTIALLFSAATRFGLTRRELARIAEVLGDAGISVPDLQMFVDGEPLTEIQVRLLSEDLDGDWPPVHLLGVMHMFKAAVLWQFSIADIIEVAKGLAASGMPTANLDLLSEAAPLNPVLLRIVAQSQLGGTQDVLTIDWLLAVAQELECSLAHIVDLVRPLSALGVHFADFDAIAIHPLGEQQMKLLSRDLDGKQPFENGLSAERLLVAMDRWQLSPGAITDLVKPLKLMGLKIPNMEALTDGPVLTETQLRWFAQVIRRSYGSDSKESDLLDVLRAQKISRTQVAMLHKLGVKTPLSISDLPSLANQQRKSLKELVSDLEPYLPLFSDIPEALLRISITSMTELLFRRVHSNEESGAYVLSCWDLAAAATQLRVPISVLSPELDALECLGVDVADCRAFARFCAENECSFVEEESPVPF